MFVHLFVKFCFYVVCNSHIIYTHKKTHTSHICVCIFIKYHDGVRISFVMCVIHHTNQLAVKRYISRLKYTPYYFVKWWWWSIWSTYIHCTHVCVIHIQYTHHRYIFYLNVILFVDCVCVHLKNMYNKNTCM